MADYSAIALEAARKAGHSADAVAAMDYRTVADLCGVVIGRKGESPADFFYTNVRADIERELRLDEEETAQKQRILDVAAKLKEIFPAAVVMVDQTGAERFFYDGKVPDGVREKETRITPIEVAVEEAIR